MSGSFQHNVLAKGQNVKRKGGFHLDTYKTGIIDRPFAEGSRGCHVFVWLDAQSLSIEELRFYIATCDKDLYYAIHHFYYFHITRSYKANFSHTNKSYIF